MFEPSAFDCLPPARLSPPAVSSLAASRQLVASQPASQPQARRPPVAHPSSSLQNGLMHRHSGGHRRDPFFAEIQYRGQRPSICESEKRDASGCLRKVLRLPRSVFSRSSCPKLTPHISTVFVHDGAISSKKLSWHIPSWHAFRVGLRSAPRRGGIPGGNCARKPHCRTAAFFRGNPLGLLVRRKWGAIA